MCLIALSTKNRSNIPLINLSRAHSRNGDGWGVMWAEKGVLHLEKDVTGYNDFYNAWNKIPLGAVCAAHFRHGTSGPNNKDMAHPFPVLVDANDHSKVTLALMHNGVLQSHKPDYQKGWSDTAVLVGELGDILCKNPKLIEQKSWRKKLGEVIQKGNKLLFMRNDGRTWIVNAESGVFEKGGIWYSNTYSFSPPASTNYYDTKEQRDFRGNYANRTWDYQWQCWSDEVGAKLERIFTSGKAINPEKYTKVLINGTEILIPKGKFPFSGKGNPFGFKTASELTHPNPPEVTSEPHGTSCDIIAADSIEQEAGRVDASAQATLPDVIALPDLTEREPGEDSCERPPAALVEMCNEILREEEALQNEGDAPISNGNSDRTLGEQVKDMVEKVFGPRHSQRPGKIDIYNATEPEIFNWIVEASAEDITDLVLDLKAGGRNSAFYGFE